MPLVKPLVIPYHGKISDAKEITICSFKGISKRHVRLQIFLKEVGNNIKMSM